VGHEPTNPPNLATKKWMHFASDTGSIRVMGTLTIKNLADETSVRLGEKADQAGLSTQEYVRRLLNRDAALTSPAELVERQSAALIDSLSHAEYEALMGRVAAMHRRSNEELSNLVARQAG
jgi:plasmid stability protein